MIMKVRAVYIVVVALPVLVQSLSPRCSRGQADGAWLYESCSNECPPSGRWQKVTCCRYDTSAGIVKECGELAESTCTDLGISIPSLLCGASPRWVCSFDFAQELAEAKTDTSLPVYLHSKFCSYCPYSKGGVREKKCSTFSEKEIDSVSPYNAVKELRYEELTFSGGTATLDYWELSQLDSSYCADQSEPFESDSQTCTNSMTPVITSVSLVNSESSSSSSSSLERRRMMDSGGKKGTALSASSSELFTFKSDGSAFVDLRPEMDYTKGGPAVFAFSGLPGTLQTSPVGASGTWIFPSTTGVERLPEFRFPVLSHGALFGAFVGGEGAVVRPEDGLTVWTIEVSATNGGGTSVYSFSLSSAEETQKSAESAVVEGPLLWGLIAAGIAAVLVGVAVLVRCLCVRKDKGAFRGLSTGKQDSACGRCCEFCLDFLLCRWEKRRERQAERDLRHIAPQLRRAATMSSSPAHSPFASGETEGSLAVSPDTLKRLKKKTQMLARQHSRRCPTTSGDCETIVTHEQTQSFSGGGGMGPGSRSRPLSPETLGRSTGGGGREGSGDDHEIGGWPDADSVVENDDEDAVFASESDEERGGRGEEERWPDIDEEGEGEEEGGDLGSEEEWEREDPAGAASHPSKEAQGRGAGIKNAWSGGLGEWPDEAEGGGEGEGEEEDSEDEGWEITR
uniref:Uncharacterized protein n=1 Tax=Chromera velia CCMP2878 TaxID=1169474 RepID=A0A0G4HM57_9ALVE|eukprot:Cvel_7461.t1-p1 / transcript=Cvel_7461.t1 / gene=Cvel_7461 / organism=Chromera_velia_CCMP2878 / gene_product=hypothetical protein / transcript_product=hypothetical protein / location=Cvel_scaffold390:79286-81322(-) / protein_length=679 / sequence_SO=supercontig / SO=protein_coding / is_pseudo=false